MKYVQYVVYGKVIKGDGYGRKLGFPTVNLQTNKEDLLPAAGVYAGAAILENKDYPAGIAVDNNGKIDAHLIGYTGDAYDKEIILIFERFLREYKKFNIEEELIAQIKKDIEICLPA